MNTREALEIKRIKAAAELVGQLAIEELSEVEAQKHLAQTAKILYAIALRKTKTAKRRAKEISEQKWSLEAKQRKALRNINDGKPQRTGFPWEPLEIQTVVKLFNARQKPLEEIASSVHRTIYSVVLKLHQLGHLTDAELSFFNRRQEAFLMKDRLAIEARKTSLKK